MNLVTVFDGADSSLHRDAAAACADKSLSSFKGLLILGVVGVLLVAIPRRRIREPAGIAKHDPEPVSAASISTLAAVDEPVPRLVSPPPPPQPLRVPTSGEVGRAFHRSQAHLTWFAIPLAIVTCARAFALGGSTALLVSVAGGVFLAVSVLVLALWSDVRSRRAADAFGGVGGLGSARLDQLRGVPAFEPIVSGLRPSRFSGGWITVEFFVDENELQLAFHGLLSWAWNSRKRPRVHVTRADLAHVVVLRARGKLWGGAVIEFHHRDGSAWAMGASGRRRLLLGFESLGIEVKEAPGSSKAP